MLLLFNNIIGDYIISSPIILLLFKEVITSSVNSNIIGELKNSFKIYIKVKER